MQPTELSTTKELRHPVAKGWFVHCVTAFGAVCGMFGLIAVADFNAKAAILWLLVAIILDGIDGPVARAWSVRENVPRIDGYTLDLVVDFVTCIVIPVVFMHRFEMLPQGWSLIIGAFVLFMSALWMSRTDQMTEDNFFNGFPGEWNMIIPTLYLLQAQAWVTGVVCVLLALTALTNWKFPHPMQVRRLRPLTITVTVVWLATIAGATYDVLPTGISDYMLVACPLYVVGMGIWRTFGVSEAA
ncbi:MAG: CDP-alcohol phosphatidyltransferase family protein [Acidobacteria bacterium]|nr:CDP-alcohol phosphatidyltransferase family protein [Acidobacteriota bacterium]